MLTDKQIRGLRPSRTTRRFYDAGGERGLVLVLSPKNQKTFALDYKSPETGKRRTFKLGRFAPDAGEHRFGLAQARTKARVLRAQIEQGTDPAEEQAREEQARLAARADERRHAEGTVTRLFDLYIESLGEKRSARDVRHYYRLHVEKTLGHRAASSVSEHDILDLLTPLAEAGKAASAKNLRLYLRAAFEFGRKIKTNLGFRRRVADFGIRHNPVVLIAAKDIREAAAKGRPQTEGRSLSRDDLRQLWPLVEQHMPLDAALALKLLLATGQRVEEVWHARVSEFDRESALWTIPGARRKNGQAHIVPIEPLHWSLIDQLTALRARKSELLIPPAKVANVRQQDGSIKRTKLDANTPRDYHALTRAVSRMLARLEKDASLPVVERFSPRDLRRTFKTLSGEIGLSKDIRDRLQGHALSDISSKAYDRYDYLIEKRVAMRQWVEFLESLTTGGADVVALPSRQQSA
jgi:integrase